MYFKVLIIKFINNVRAPKHAVISPPAVREVILVAACQRTIFEAQPQERTAKL